MALLIPFGKRRSDGLLVDVSAVPRGLACDCICPACGIPLIGKRGDDRAWHFAHETSDLDAEGNIKECKQSYYVSIRMMLRQLLTTKFQFLGPELEIELDGKPHKLANKASFDVSKANVEINPRFADFVFDFKVTFSKAELYLYISHPERACPPPEVFNSLSDKVGLLEFDIKHLPLLQTSRNSHDGEVISAHDQLREWLESDTNGKFWRYHPREAAARLAFAAAQREAERKLQELNAQVQQERQDLDERRRSLWRKARTAISEQESKVSCTCRLCRHDFWGKAGIINTCPVCGKHEHVWSNEPPKISSHQSHSQPYRYKKK